MIEDGSDREIYLGEIDGTFRLDSTCVRRHYVALTS